MLLLLSSLCLLLFYFNNFKYFPQVLLLWTCAVKHWAWPRLWFIHEVQWGRPLMSMNYLKATLFWTIPLFGKYFPALHPQVLPIVVVCGDDDTWTDIKDKSEKWTQVVSTDKSAQVCVTVLHILIHISKCAHFHNQFKCFLNVCYML